VTYDPQQTDNAAHSGANVGSSGATIAGTTATFELDAEGSAGTSEKTCVMANSATDYACFMYQSASDEPAVAGWATGTVAVLIDVTTAQMGLDLEAIYVDRRTTGGSYGNWGSLTAINEDWGTTGVKGPHNVSVGVDLGASTDTLYIVLVLNFGSGMNNGVGVTGSQVITTPIQPPVGDVTITPDPAAVPAVAPDVAAEYGTILLQGDGDSTAIPAVAPPVQVVYTVKPDPAIASMERLVPQPNPPIPNVTYGTFLTPDATPVPVAAPDPTIVYGIITAPDTAPVPAVAPEVTLVYGVILDQVGDSAVAVVPVVVPAVVAGSFTTITPDAAAVPVVAPTPTIVYGVVVAPDAVAVPAVAPDVTIDPGTGGTVTLTPDAAAVPVVAPAAVATAGTILLPDASPAPVVAPAPSVTYAVILTPDAVVVPVVAPAPQLSYGLNPSAVGVPVVMPAPVVEYGVVIAPDASAAPVVAPEVTIDAGVTPGTKTPQPVVITVSVPSVGLAFTVRPDPVGLAVLVPAVMAELVTVERRERLTTGVAISGRVQADAGWETEAHGDAGARSESQGDIGHD
jgi:hypothetical protein